MCTVSMVGDHFSDKQAWPTWPTILPFPGQVPYSPLPSAPPTQQYRVSRAEFGALKAQVEEMKRELLAAKQQDIADGNPDCEMEAKVSILKQIAEQFGVDLKEVFPNG
jgi:hypothetical protein